MPTAGCARTSRSLKQFFARTSHESGSVQTEVRAEGARDRVRDGDRAAFVERLAALGFDLVLVDIETRAIAEQGERLRSRVDVREAAVDLADPAQDSCAPDSIA